MKKTPKKITFVAAAVVFAGLVTHTAVHGAGMPWAQQAAELNTPVVIVSSVFPPGGHQDVYRSVILTGKIIYQGGKPAAGIAVAAQCQNAEFLKFAEAHQKQSTVGGHGFIPATREQQEGSWNNAVSRSDGTYVLPVVANIPYNVMAFDHTGKWVAAAREGVQGQKNTTVKVPVLMLTAGSLVEGSVTDTAGLPMPGADVSSYDPHRPASSAAVDFVKTDPQGRYRLRVAPGVCQVYTGNGQGNSSQNITVGARQVVTLNLKCP